ncbi:class I SAM-dependent methyltransferase [Rhizobium sp. L1K21]|uniref:class I SAM-dependent methyltransferase n=1 Tax=Rhizobium sp. L1K21 TaxID=2954933 RepID=UPI002093F36E|nr:class I SAM-dependent methyltransferase [Rhizobium sp. L1K21]MCO6184629.1 class I SAM-dependent methyltransferase [Rhizobium sp. L1K21]
MSGFDMDWLGLREPVDVAARDQGLIAALAGYLESQPAPYLVDLGCGTGSTLRSLQPALPADTKWLLLDHDPILLEEAMKRSAAVMHVNVGEYDLNDIATLPLDDVSVVTASALFDLCSEAFCAALVARIADAGCGLYAALNYDGAIEWSQAHLLDVDVVSAFNRHQRTDKGLGMALGPDATACLERLLRARGYRVDIRPSPWRMDSSMAALQTAFLNGFRQPLLDASKLEPEEIQGWLSYRLEAIPAPESLCKVGHLDLLALPA